MDEAARTGSQEVDTDADSDRSPEEIRADIERTRRELGDTAAAVAAKADVKAQARAKENPLPVATGAAFVVGFVLGRMTRRS